MIFVHNPAYLGPDSGGIWDWDYRGPVSGPTDFILDGTCPTPSFVHMKEGSSTEICCCPSEANGESESGDPNNESNSDTTDNLLCCWDKCEIQPKDCLPQDLEWEWDKGINAFKANRPSKY